MDKKPEPRTAAEINSRPASNLRQTTAGGLRQRWLRRTGVAGACLVLAACQALPPLGQVTASKAVAPVANPAFVAAGGGHGEHRGGLSGVALMDDGQEAFAARVAMARLARQSLDIQYYIWDGDKTGTFLLGELLAAADRGVRVRLLLDDVNSRGIVDGILSQLTGGLRAAAAELEDGVSLVTPQALERQNRTRHLMKEIHSNGRDLLLAALDTHPNIKVRMFNPIPSRNLGEFVRHFQLVGNFSRLNRRMHNKVFAADNQLAVVGGRNIADNYFGMDEEYNFRDLDLLVRGPAVRDVSANFDLYWNSRWAVPVRAFAWYPRSEWRLVELRKELAAVFRQETDPRLRKLQPDSAVAATLRATTSRMIEAPVSVIADVPEKFSGSGQPLVAEALGRLAGDCRKEILIESAYFVPSNRTFAKMEERLANGVKIRTLTNSLASNDEVPAQAGYARHRKRLLRAGVEMHELRPYGATATRVGFLFPNTRAGLHTKTEVFDRQRVFVGTFNLDPRSAELNTEIGLLVDSPQMASQVARVIEDGMRGQRSWQVRLWNKGDPGKGCGNGRLQWSAGEPPNQAWFCHEPDADLLSRAMMSLLSWLPIDPLL